jgi:hypothetical protein
MDVVSGPSGRRPARKNRSEGRAHAVPSRWDSVDPRAMNQSILEPIGGSLRMSPFEARELIVKGSGTEFDPEVVEAFLAVFRRGEMEVPFVVV